MLTDVSTDPLLAALKDHWGYSDFRPLQREAMNAVRAGRDSVVVLPTGGGKSLCYQVPAVCGGRLAVVVSPLISLMKDQVDALRACGVPAACVNSSLSAEERQAVAEDVRAGRLRLLYVAPERLVGDAMLDFLGEAGVDFFAIDEAHCISQWGHDFRPEYRRLNLLKERFPGVGVHAYTATATERVRDDIANQLGLDRPEVLVGDFDRPNLCYRVLRRSDRLAQITEVIDKHPDESGIVYCISRKEVDELTDRLRSRGLRAVAYHAGLSDDDRHRHQDAFLGDKADIVVATVAFGMGIDKPNVRYVVHSGMPKSLEHYQQEAGRAGRDGLEADCVLLYSGADVALWKRMQAGLDPETRAAAETSLNAMAAYCSGATCRHKSLVEHFGQPFRHEACGACDVCLGEIDLVENPLLLAQKIVSCVHRLEQRYGAEYTALVLTGSEDERIERSGHDRLSTFGLLSDEPKKAVRGWIDQLLGQGYLRKAGEYGVLQITPEGRRLLKGEAEPRLLRPAPPKKKERTRRTPAEDGWDGVDRDLFERLRRLRAETAEERNVPPYIVFGDVTLRDLARRKPTTRAALLDVRGVGPAKADTFGPAFLTAIREHCEERGLPVAEDDEPSGGRQPSEGRESRGESREKESRGPSAGAKAAFALFREGRGVEEVAAELGRAASTVQSYLQQYLRAEAVIDPSPWVDAATAARVRDAIEECGGSLLRPIHERLGGDVPYEAIRVVVECLRNADGGG